MLKYWFDDGVLYKLNERVRKGKVVVVKDYVVVYGVPDKWIEAMNLKEKEVLFRVEFESLGGIELGIEKVVVYPDRLGFGVLNSWLGEMYDN